VVTLHGVAPHCVHEIDGDFLALEEAMVPEQCLFARIRNFIVVLSGGQSVLP
jgi:hypothetical protein